MSAPHTDVPRQAKRHWGPILGITAIVVFVGVLFVGWLYWEADRATEPEVQGAPTTTEPAAPATGSGTAP